MAIGRDGWRYSQLAGCLDRSGVYLLGRAQARQIIDHQIEVIHAEWEDAADLARLTRAQRRQLWGRQVLNPYCLYDYPTSSASHG